MLEGLNAVCWYELTHAYGRAGGIPVLIARLASPDPREWVPAMSSLYDTLCHQMCSVCEATAPAIPFLVDLSGAGPPGSRRD